MVELSRTPAPPTADLDLVFRECQRDLLRTVVPLTGGDRAAAEDVVAEAFARAQREWHRVGGYDRPDLWLRRVALNLAITDHRTRVRRRGRRLDPRPEATLDDASVEVLEVVRSLPTRQAQVVVLVYFAGESVAGAARVLGIAEPTARTHHTRALATLATTLSDEEDR
ncbi:MAG TPA: sigma factor-like helix-turn-helix DNA-binding protein [Iamia sp.]|nr:sigma factor-like helix-turn-helix DNA-binding protein [Iamia sp.]